MKTKYSYDNKANLIADINNHLKSYEGFIQFSHRPINKEIDIFYDGKEIQIEDEKGFIYEAHFYNGKKSISIRQINEHWLVSTTDISKSKVDEKDIEKYISDIEGFDYKIKMAQIWKETNDDLCCNMEVMKLQKVVFVGFEKGEER